jgi:hypothetical protein
MPLTQDERIIRTALVRVAHQANHGGRGADSYTNVGRLVGLDMELAPDRATISEMLDHISREEHSAGRPLLSAVVVHENDGILSIPGRGFFDLARNLGLLQGRQAMSEVIFLADELRRVYQTPYPP